MALIRWGLPAAAGFIMGEMWLHIGPVPALLALMASTFMLIGQVAGQMMADSQ